MAQLKNVNVPAKLVTSLRDLGRLDPVGRMIMDNVGPEGGMKAAREVEGIRFQPIELGYLGRMYVIDDQEGESNLVSEHQGRSLLKRLEKRAAEKAKAESVEV